MEIVVKAIIVGMQPCIAIEACIMRNKVRAGDYRYILHIFCCQPDLFFNIRKGANSRDLLPVGTPYRRDNKGFYAKVSKL